MSKPIKQTIRLNRRLGRVTINGVEHGRWSRQPKIAEEVVRSLLAESTDTCGRPVERYCPDLFPYRNSRVKG